MSRSKEILERYGLDKISITRNIKETELWPRFKKVKQVVLETTKHDCKGIKRTIETHSWSGEDRGIYDHIGTICGTLNNIDVHLNIKGITYDRKLNVVFDGVNDWTIMNSHGRVSKIWGTFKSADGRNGYYLNVNGDNNQSYEAYYLQTEGNKLRLEQVVENGRVFDAENLKRFCNDVETERGVSLPAMRFVKKE